MSLLDSIGVVAGSATLASLLIAAILYGKPNHESAELFWSVTAMLMSLMWVLVIGLIIVRSQPTGW